MKLIDILTNVDKSDSDYVDQEDLREYFQLANYGDYSDEFDKRVKGYYVVRWYCTDTYVGLMAIYLDDELVGMSRQTARKNKCEFEWLSQEAAERVRNVLSPATPKFDILDPDTDYAPFYSVSYSGEVLDLEGFYKGVPVKVTNRRPNPKNYIDQELIVSDGTKEFKIPVSEYKMPLRTKLSLGSVCTGTEIPIR